MLTNTVVIKQVYSCNAICALNDAQALGVCTNSTKLSAKLGATAVVAILGLKEIVDAEGRFSGLTMKNSTNNSEKLSFTIPS